MAKTEKKSDFTNKIFEKLGSNKAINEAQRVINMAVDVLEEEVAAGILAAKKIEKNIIDVDKARGGDPEDVLNRFRRDAHEVLDIFMDSVSVLYQKADSIKNEFVKSDDNPVNTKTQGIPVIKPEHVCKPGQSVELPVSLTNDEETEKTIAFAKTELISASGEKITARNIKIEPASVSLKPGDKKVIVFKINIIKSAKNGIYSGLIIDAHDAHTRLLLEVEVDKS